MIPIGTDRPQRRVPLMNILLIAANVVIYMLSHQADLAPGQRPDSSGLSGSWPNYILNGGPHLELYQFLTYQFLHQNLMHLVGNMLFLYVFGNNLNEKLGHVSYLAFYLAGGVLAGCGQLLTSNAPTLGASGAISAIAGLFFVLLPRTNVRIFFWVLVYVDVFEIPSMYFILLNVAKDVFEPHLFPGDHSVAYYAHLTGNVAGFVMGMILLLSGLVQRDHYDLLSLINRYRRRKAYEALVAGGYDPYGYNPKHDAPPPRAVAAARPTDPRLYDLREKVFAALRGRDLPAAAAAYLELKALDPDQVLPVQEQLDVANQLMSTGGYAQAATAYEDYLRVYPRAHQSEQVQLILGLIYANYLPRRERAAELLRAALPRLHDAAQRDLAAAELARLTAPAPAAPETTSPRPPASPQS